MTPFRCWRPTLLALALVVPTGTSAEPPCTRPQCRMVIGCSTGISTCRSAAVQDRSYVIYSLGDMGEDPAFCQWIAETIPEVIEPGSWTCAGASGKKPVLRYYAPKKILVVCHTAAVQAKVDRFLKTMKKALPRETGRPVAGRGPMQDHKVVPARYQAPALLNPPLPAPGPNPGYPVPPPARHPKHLFHFIIRYEGAGIIDSNVVKYMKMQAEQKPAPASESEKKEKEETSSPGVEVPEAEFGAAAGGLVTPAKEWKEEKARPATHSASPSCIVRAAEDEAPKKGADKKEKEDKKTSSVTSDPLTSPKTKCDKEDVKAKDDKKP